MKNLSLFLFRLSGARTVSRKLALNLNKLCRRTVQKIQVMTMLNATALFAFYFRASDSPGLFCYRGRGDLINMLDDLFGQNIMSFLFNAKTLPAIPAKPVVNPQTKSASIMPALRLFCFVN